jgi:hypothetical protein
LASASRAKKSTNSTCPGPAFAVYRSTPDR